MNPWMAGVLFGGSIGFALGVLATIAWSLAAAASRADDEAEEIHRRRQSPDYVPDDWSA